MGNYHGRVGRLACIVAFAAGVLLTGCATGVAAPVITSSHGPATVAESAGCKSDGISSSKFATVGDLEVSRPTLASNMILGMLPNSAPHAPYLIPAPLALAQTLPSPRANPDLTFYGYVMEICNTSAEAHILSNLDVKIAHFTPSTATIDEFSSCGGGNMYDADGSNIYAGMTCPSDEFTAGDYLTVVLPTDTTGTSANAKYIGPTPSGVRAGASLPIRIDPQSSVTVDVTVFGVIHEGLYTFSFGVGADDGPSVTLTPINGPIFYAPNTLDWDGPNCQSAGMQAKIPPATHDAYYVCPPAA